MRCLVLLMMVCAACAEVGPTEPVVMPAACEGSHGLALQEHIPELHPVGPAANRIARFDDEIWVVESQANTISVLRNDEWLSGHIHVGSSRNPYDMHVDDDRVYITNWLRGSLTIADRKSGAIVDEIEGLGSAAGVTLTSQYIYVTDVEYRFEDGGFGPGKVHLIDRATLEKRGTLTTAFRNPQYLFTFSFQGQEYVLVVSSGSIAIEGDRGVVLDDGGIELLVETSNPLAPEREVFGLALSPGEDTDNRLGAAGRPLWHEQQGRLYFSSATAPVLFVFDMQARSFVHGTQDPFYFATHQDDGLHHGHLDPLGLVWVTSFNQDAIVAIDTSCMAIFEPVSVATSPFLRGPHGLVSSVDGDTLTLHYLTSLGHAMGRMVFRIE